MRRFKSYIAPSKKDPESGRDPLPPMPAMEMVNSPLEPPTFPNSAATTVPNSAATSRPASIYPDGDFRNGGDDEILEIKSDMMVNYIYQDLVERMWTSEGPGEGVVLKKKRRNYVCCPRTLETDEYPFFDAIRDMNVRCAMTVNTQIVKIFMSQASAFETIPLTKELSIQVLDRIEDLAGSQCNTHQFAAFIRDVSILVVWEDDPTRLIDRAAKLEEKLLSMVWDTDHSGAAKEKEGANVTISEEVDYDAELATETERPTRLQDPIMVAFTLALLIAALATGYRNLVKQVAVDKNYIRLLLILYTPINAFLCLFFMQVIVGNLCQIFGPISNLKQNSKIYSAIPSVRLQRDRQVFPHITIQCPVYKEGLAAVIEPTVHSIKAAISTYEMQGGTANIFVNDDGMQLISEEEAQARREFYDEHNIGWVARPGHNKILKEGEKPFLRRGKFKKASNMNFAMMISNRVEEKLQVIDRSNAWTQDKEQQAYEICLQQVLQEDDRAWAEGNIRLGDYLLLIDSDTRVPTDCLLDAASEMEASPEVAILQYSCGVMQVADNFFENGVTFFTNLVYTAIKYTVSNGGVCPFVGHNAILRWSAVQQVVYFDEDNYEKFWSESHVSEDFDMALRLQCNGYTIRLGAYTGDGFKEGVSLTVYDELARWEKYAYGCNELLFHPIRFWLLRGPFTPLFRKFLGSNIRLTSKIAILGYIGTYYAIGAAWILTLLNYFLIGWFNGHLDQFYLESFKVYVSIVVVFNGLGNIALAAIRYRNEEDSFFHGLAMNFKWVIMMTIFLGGISLHVSQALLSHMFEIDMNWGATSKEVEETSFFVEIRKVLKNFKGTFIFCIGCAIMMVVFACFLPPLWRFSGVTSCYPLASIIFCHFMLPLALNPALMKFTW
ncbi:MAG: hypothetical protein M1814_002207 [Vezdaea aestivalis]|nr:MAG: hypothetical protein M1814_002207 [Vezdaea aestivalis]